MLNALLHQHALVPGSQQLRHVFTLDQYYRQTPYAFGRDADHFSNCAHMIGLFDEPPAARDSCWVANLDPRKLGDLTCAHLIFDFDGLERAPDDVVFTVYDLATQVTDTLRQHIVNAATLDFDISITGCQPADKDGAFSFHIHYQRIRLGARPPKYLMAALNRLPAVVALRLHADRSIYTNGIRFGTCSKPLREHGWRKEHMRLLMGSWSFPLHNTADLDEDYTAQWAQEEAEEEREARAPAVASPLTEAALATYRRFFDANARIQATGVIELGNGTTRIHFVDSAANHCVHRGNNHYAVVRGQQMTVFCGGGQEQAATFALPAYEVEEEEASYVEQLLAWLRRRPYTHVGMPFTAAEYATLGRVPDHPLALAVDTRVFCIDVATFDELLAAGASHDDLAKYLNLGMTLSSSTQTWHIKAPDGLINNVSMHFLQQATANFRVPQEKNDELKPFLRLALQLPCWTAMSRLDFYRALDPEPGERAVVIRRVNPGPMDEEHPLSAEVMSWFTIYAELLVHNSSSASAEEEDIRPALKTWVINWIMEVIFGYQPLGVALGLVEPVGGTGKSLLAAIITNILGAHQSHTITNMQKFLNHSFNFSFMQKRFFAYDDGVPGGNELTHAKNFVTQISATTNVKFGTDGLVVDFRGALLWLCNNLDPSLMKGVITQSERRFLFASPGRAYEEVLGRMDDEDRQTAIQWFGATNEEFLNYGYTHLADASSAPTEHAVALCRGLLATYLQRCETFSDPSAPTLKHWLRAQVEGQQLLTRVRDEAALAALGALGSWIAESISAGTFFDAATSPGRDGNIVFMYSGPKRCVLPDGSECAAYWHVESLRLLYVAFTHGNRAVDANQTSNTSSFRQAFANAFDTIQGGTEGSFINRMRRLDAVQYTYRAGQGWMLTAAEARLQVRGFYELTYRAHSAAMEEED